MLLPGFPFDAAFPSRIFLAVSWTLPFATASRCFALGKLATCAAASSDTSPSVTACTSSLAPSLAILAALLVASRRRSTAWLLAPLTYHRRSGLDPGRRGGPRFTEIPSVRSLASAANSGRPWRRALPVVGR